MPASSNFADASAISLKTPMGTIFHTGDFKLDRSPIDNKKTNIKRIKEIGDNGVMLMLGESTNVEKQGYTMSEKRVGENLAGFFLFPGCIAVRLLPQKHRRTPACRTDTGIQVCKPAMSKYAEPRNR